MLKGLKKYIALMLAFVMCLTLNMNVWAATIKELNSNDVFLKQQTSITCTLSSAAMMLRRTAICANYADWDKITEKSIEPEAWVESVGLRWKFTAFGMSVDHGYFSSSNKKQQILDLLKIYPQGFVIYNSGSMGQKHAVFLCDYDEKNDIFYAADPANTVAKGRMPLTETSMAGSTQKEIINNLNAYWYVTNPAVSDENGNLSAEQVIDSNEYNPAKDIEKFNATQQQINEYYVVTSSLTTNLRAYPSGNATAVQSVKAGDLLYIESVGNNNFGAKWYKTDADSYVFNTNLTPLSQYSSDIGKFNQTATEVNATYSASALTSTVPLRIDATEGNNIVAFIKNGTKLYITQSGFNSVGASWLRTEDGYYVKASDMKFESAEKNNDSLADVEFIQLNGSYSAEPIEDFTAETKLYKVTASSLNVRKAPVNGEIIGSLKNGECVEVIQTVDGWCNIIYNGNSAWISLNYLVLLADGNSSTNASLIISETIVQSGNKITCTVENDGNNKYSYTVYSADGNVVYSPNKFVADKSFTYIADNTGKYYFGVEISTGNENTHNIYSANFTVYPKLEISSVKCDAAKTQYVNKMLTWTVKAADEYDDAVYVYELYKNGKIISTSESYVASYSYAPKETGEYYLSVKLKDTYSSSAVKKSDSVKIVDELSVDAFELGCTIASAGDNITCSAKASGGAGKIEYSFYAYLDGKAVVSTKYSQQSSVSITLDTPGEYTVNCYVKDENGTIVKKSFNLTVIGQLKGDIDFDGIVTAADARLVLRHSASLELLYGASLAAADVNKDEIVTSEDARLILRYAAGLE